MGTLRFFQSLHLEVPGHFLRARPGSSTCIEKKETHVEAKSLPVDIREQLKCMRGSACLSTAILHYFVNVPFVVALF